MHNPLNMSQVAVHYSKRDKHWAVPNVIIKNIFDFIPDSFYVCTELHYTHSRADFIRSLTPYKQLMYVLYNCLISISCTTWRWPLSSAETCSCTFDVLLTVHRSIFISVFNQLDPQNLFHNKFYFMPLHVSNTCAHHQEVKIVLHSSKHVEAWYKTYYETNFVNQVG